MKPRALVLHTVGKSGDPSAAQIRKFHMAPRPHGNGWKDIGYHFVVRKDGRVEPGRPLNCAGAHLEGANDTWGVCVTGDGDREPWTPAQRAAVMALAERVCREQSWGADRVIGHREGPARLGAKPTAKRCPGRLVNMADVRRELEARLASAASPQEQDRT